MNNINVCVSSQMTFYLSLCLPPGGFCEMETDGCTDRPCSVGTNCTDLSPAEQVQFSRAYNCSKCPAGYVEDDSICVGQWKYMNHSDSDLVACGARWHSG